MKILLTILITFTVLAIGSQGKKIVCYFDSSDLHKTDDAKFYLSYLQPHLCTHIIYNFIELNDNAELVDDCTKSDVTQFVEHVKHARSDIKVIIANGGRKQGIEVFSKITTDSELRTKFVASAVSYLKKYDLDGFDLNWEDFMVKEGGSQINQENFYELLQELKTAFKEENLILSIAVKATQLSHKLSYNISKVSESVDFVNLLTYDMHSWKDGKTGENAPLYVGSWEAGNDTFLNVDSTITSWLQKGAPAEKLILGLAFFGKSFTLANYAISRPTIGSPSQGPGNPGPISKEGGILDYIEICQMVKDSHWTVEYDYEQRVPYAALGNLWIGYDNENSITEKVQYVNKHALGGVVVSKIESDDYLGKCGDKYPLLNTVNKVISH